ncbi:arsenate reductase [Alkalilimnicola ehrlichii MLHE-1]|uniref:Arsenate reductase n=2 Tax=Alkalilimnicola ehrlichii TaxID=351052 RepID=Q0AAF7_ALKEH|nr:arsenate reductase [Alkalilimnicola ehrlichii MLHE-1]
METGLREETLMRYYHNPRCSKSREGLKLLQAHGVEPEVIQYLKTPPGTDELASLMERLDIHDPRGMMRRKEKLYKELALDDPGLDRETLLQAIAEHPRLLERPIGVSDRGAVIGRPPERLLELLA